MTALVELKEVVKVYGRIAALRGVDLHVERGTVQAILGPNGAGKTTLLKVVACLEEPTGGEVYWDGMRVEARDRERVRRRATMVFQKPILFDTTVYKNITYGLRVRGLPETEIKERAGRALVDLGLKGIEERAARGLSGGEQQRVSLARALVLDPELLLLDEPTVHLDPSSASLIEEVIGGLKGRAAVLLATLSPLQAQRLSDRVTLLMDGLPVAEGASGDVLAGSREEWQASLNPRTSFF